MLSGSGGATGLTYGQRAALYTIIGNRVFFEIYILLSNKGSSSGLVNVTNLPVATANVANMFPTYTVACTGMASMSGHLFSFSVPNTNIARIQQLDTGTSGDLTDANFTNTSEIFISGSYQRL